MTEPLLTKQQLAARLQVSTRTIDRYRAMGYDLGEVRLPGGTVRFDPQVAQSGIQRGRWRRRRADPSRTGPDG